MASSTLSSFFKKDAPPVALRLRCHYWFATFVITLGIATDLLVYSIVIPVFPFRLERLGYTGVSGLVGWLLTSFSAGLVVSTIPIAMLSERYSSRAWPLNIGLILLLGSQIMLMLAPVYWLMCIARVLQGVASSTVWVVGLALVCDLTPKKYIGKQLGIVMAGFSLGLLLGPTIGGALYVHFGYHGPFVFGIIAAALDLFFRLLIIERKDALKWGIDPCADPDAPSVVDPEHISEERKEPTGPNQPVAPVEDAHADDVSPPEKHLSFVKVVLRMGKSPRALAALFLTAFEAFVFSAQEPAITLHLAAVWGLNPSQVGLVFLAFSIPAMISAPISGWLCDVRGAEWVTTIGLLLAIPWETVIILEKSLILFIVSLAIGSFFISSSMSPLMSELAAVSRTIDGVGYAHVYGAFNLIYGVGSAIGPILGGQMYDHIHRGWMAICLLSVGMLVIAIIIGFFSTGDVPFAMKIKNLRAVGAHEKDRAQNDS